MNRLAWTAIACAVLGCGSSGSRWYDLPDGGATGTDGDGGVDPGSFKDGGPTTDPAASCTEAAKQQGYAGCDFVFSPPPLLSETTRPPCFAAFLANNSAAPAKVSVSYDGTTIANVAKFARLPNGNPDPTTWAPLPPTGIPGKAVAVLFLSHDPTSKHIVMGTSLACPVDTAVQEPQGATVPWPNRGKSFHVQIDRPVTAYDMAPFGGAKSFFPSAELLLPTTAWGKNYVVAIPPLGVPPSSSDSVTESAWVQIVAKDDGTQVTLQATTDLEAPSMADAVSPSATKTISLNAGEMIQYHQWRSPSAKADMSGTIISSTKPVGVTGGDMAMKVATKDSAKTAPFKGDPTPRFCCLDSAHQMIPPISGLGFDYVAAPYTTRRADLAEESILYRIVGVIDGTTLTFDPPVAGAPSSIGQGQVVDLEISGPARIKSQDKNHPFLLSQTMSYSTVGGGTRRDGDPTWPIQPQENGQRETGDPEWVNVLPPAQFIKEYAFVTDPTYAVTSLVLTRVKDGGAFHDVTVDCLGTVTGWQPVGASGTYEMARVDLVRGGKGVGACQNGAHTASSQGGFGVTVWGIDWWASYAYPAGGSAFKINDVVVTPN